MQHLFSVFGWMLTVAVLVAATGCDTTSSTSTDAMPSSDISLEETSWIQDHSHPLAAPGDTSDRGDLAPLQDVVGDARVVGVGDASYGGREAFQMKRRVVRYLIAEMGFDAVVFEATLPESFGVDAYVRHGQGTPGQRLDDLHFWTWNTHEVASLLEWMRGHNAAQTGSSFLASAARFSARPAAASATAGFYGIDMQYPGPAIDSVAAYVERVDPDAQSRVADYYSCYRQYTGTRTNRQRYRDADRAVHAECQRGIEAVLNLFDDNEDAYVRASSAAAFARFRRHARLVEQSERYYRGDTAYRNQAMADNLDWLLRWLGPDSRVVLWSHNVHVSKTPIAFSPMGSILADTYGSDYVSLGLAFYEGRINAVGIREDGSPGDVQSADVPPPPSGEPQRFVENYLQAAGDGPMLLDLRTADGDSDGSAWATEPRDLRAIGAVYDPARPAEYFEPVRLARSFDALLYLPRMTPSHLR